MKFVKLVNPIIATRGFSVNLAMRVRLLGGLGVLQFSPGPGLVGAALLGPWRDRRCASLVRGGSVVRIFGSRLVGDVRI